MESRETAHANVEAGSTDLGASNQNEVNGNPLLSNLARTSVNAPPLLSSPISTPTFSLGRASSPADTSASLVSNNAPGFKFKYPEAKPTPEGVDDGIWNKVYTAADSRMYNKHGKDANNSRKYRQSGETRALALVMLEERKAKEAAGILPRPSKPRVSGAKDFSAKESIGGSRDGTPSGDILPMSISEKIKAEGRARKATSVGPSSAGTTPVPSGLGVKEFVKRGTAKPSKKPPQKKPKFDYNIGTPSSSGRASQTPVPMALEALSDDDSDASSRSGTLYCICQKPDDHSLMIECAGCQGWFHPRCMKISDLDVRDCLVDRFVCPDCSTPEFMTNFKRICRMFNVNQSCRNPARVNDTPPHKPSKYCSENCRQAFWEHVNSVMRKDHKPSMGGALNRYEVAHLLAACPSVEAFNLLGSKPKLIGVTPESDRPLGLQFFTDDEAFYIKEINDIKDVYKQRISEFQNQVKLLNMVHERAKRAMQHLGKDNKSAICGYDSRLGFNPDQFKSWFASEEAQSAYSLGVLGPRSEATQGVNTRLPTSTTAHPVNGVANGDSSDITKDMCLLPARKCKHLGWREMHNQEFNENQATYKAKIAKLERDIIECIEDAETREATRDYYADNKVRYWDNPTDPLPGY